MRILVVDDETVKRERVCAFLREQFEGICLEEAKSFQSALERILSTRYDLIVLDMRLTTYDVTGVDGGGRPRNFGGEEIMRKMQRRRVSTRVVVLTQYTQFAELGLVVTFEQLFERLRGQYPNFLGMVHFGQSNDQWMTDLSEILTERE